MEQILLINKQQFLNIMNKIYPIFGSSTTYDRRTKHLKFDLTRGQTHDLQIIWQYISCHWEACSNHLAISDLRTEVPFTPKFHLTGFKFMASRYHSTLHATVKLALTTRSSVTSDWSKTEIPDIMHDYHAPNTPLCTWGLRKNCISYRHSMLVM